MPKTTLDRVMFLGGGDLSFFQSCSLVGIGIAVIILVVAPLLFYEFESPPEIRLPAAAFLAVAMALWAVAMIANGAVGIAKLRGRKDRKSLGTSHPRHR